MTDENKLVEALLPCPFCGGRDIACVPAEESPDYDSDYPVVVACMDCSANGPSREFTSAADAIAAWNRREVPVPLVSTSGVLRCYDCGRPYVKGPDLVVPDAEWAKIAPKPDGGGVLCPNCMIDRFEAIGAKNVRAVFTSGPFASLSLETEEGLITRLNGRAQTDTGSEYTQRDAELDREAAKAIATLRRESIEFRQEAMALTGKLVRAEAERDAAREALKAIGETLEWMNRKGGLGHQVHAELDTALRRARSAAKKDDC
jgi:Lar family restriction alleviation protein